MICLELHESALPWFAAGNACLPKNPSKACRLMAHGLQYWPTNAAAYYNLGLAQHLRGQIDAAVRAYQLSASLPNPPRQALFNNLSQDLLMLNRFEEGWQAYEGRPERPHHQQLEEALGPAWAGEPLKGPLLVAAEQGFGDTLMFLRFALLLQERNVDLSLWCQAPLVELLRHAAPSLQAEAAVSLAGFRHWVSLLSLPRLLRCHVTPFPFDRGYLQLDSAWVNTWRQRLQRRPGHRLIGLHWQGSRQSETSMYSAGRSLPLTELASLLQLPSCEFVSLQKGDGSDQWPGVFAGRMVAGQPAVSASMDFLDTAAVLANCDLLITADSAVVHLAGALALPVWVLLKAVPEWRWGLDTSQSTWYQSVRLFRQPQPGHWQEPIGQMLEALRGWDASTLSMN